MTAWKSVNLHSTHLMLPFPQAIPYFRKINRRWKFYQSLHTFFNLIRLDLSKQQNIHPSICYSIWLYTRNLLREIFITKRQQILNSRNVNFLESRKGKVFLPVHFYEIQTSTLSTYLIRFNSTRELPQI